MWNNLLKRVVYFLLGKYKPCKTIILFVSLLASEIHIRSSSLFSCHRILPCNSYTRLRDSSAGVDIHTDLPSLPQTRLPTITHARTYMSIQRNCLQPHIGSSKSSSRIISFENLGYPRSASAARNLTSSDTCIEISHQRCDVCVVT